MEQRYGKLLVAVKHTSIVVRYTPIANTIIILKEPAECDACGKELKIGSLVKRQILLETYRKLTVPLQKHMRYYHIECKPEGFPRRMQNVQRLYRTS